MLCTDSHASNYKYEGIATIVSHEVFPTLTCKHTAQLLKSSCSLIQLDLGGCDLGGAADVTRLLEALKDNTTWINLMLSRRYRDTVTSKEVYRSIKNRVKF